MLEVVADRRLARPGAKHGPQVSVSRIHPGLVKRLFELEVPEIQSGIVQIKSISREAGSRTKMAVHSTDPMIDPVGSCVGPRGQRVDRVVTELRGEKIDIIKWSADPAEFVANALNPRARGERVRQRARRRPAAWSCRTISSRWPSARKARTPASPRA